LEHVQAEQLDSKQVNLTGIVAADAPSKQFKTTKGVARYRAGTHAELVNIALTGEQILHINSLATVTGKFVVVRRPEMRAEAIIGLPSISKLKRIETTRPGLLVIAIGLFLLAAAAACSKQGDQAQIPLGVTGALFVIAYFLTRRAAVAFVVDCEATETMHGSLSEAAELIKAMEKAQTPLPAFETATSGS
jgi:hypothetical protein